MHQRLMSIFIAIVMLLAACQGPPPTQIILVVTATPEGSQPSETAGAQATATQTGEATATAIPTTPAPQVTPTLDPFPTPTISQIQVAEQVFEHGRMFWVQPTQQIWVMIITGEGHGDWRVYEDTFVDGEPEFDPQIIPPDGMQQPKRGFGKLWRDNPDVRDALGWAITPEFGYVTTYEYHPGGSVDANGKYVPGPGYHILSSLYEEKFRFNEADQTWRLN